MMHALVLLCLTVAGLANCYYGQDHDLGDGVWGDFDTTESNVPPSELEEISKTDDEALQLLLEYIDRQFEMKSFASNITVEELLRLKRSFRRQIRMDKKNKGKEVCNVHEIIKSSPLCMCSKPRKEMVEVPASHQANVITIPRCFEIERCNGPCMNPNMKCLPFKMQMLDVPVFAIRFSKGSDAVPTDCATTQIERHLKCGCRCAIKESDCNPKQIFAENECNCKCRDVREALACIEERKFWDEVHCKCRCPLTSYVECSTGLYFHPDLCKCVLENEV